MKTSRKSKLLMAAVLGCVVSFAAVACPGGHAHDGKGGNSRLVKTLDLTDAQVTQLKSLRESHKSERKQNKAAMKAIHEQKQALLANYSDEKAQAIANELAAMHKERVLTKLQHQQALYAMLDDEQKEKFKEVLAKHPKPNRKHKGEHDKNN
jgi:protein CpxP